MNTTFGRGYPEPPEGVSRAAWGKQCDEIAMAAFLRGETGRVLEPSHPYHWLGAEAKNFRVFK